MDQRPVIISCDGHATGRPEDYRPYIESAYLEEYENFVATLEKRREEQAKAREGNRSLFSKEGSDEFEKETGDGRSGEWDSSVRAEVLEGEGVVAEVLFPNGGEPFGGVGQSVDHELRAAGARAYDRWLLDFANDLPGRRAALAMVTVHDIEAAVAEIRWASRQGMKGVFLPTVPGENLPPYYDPCYDPIWSACEDCELPIHFHGGGGTPNYGNYGVVSMLMYATEATYFSHRNFWILVWGAVFERFPRLSVVFTETRMDWVPGTLFSLDRIYEASFFSHIRDTVKMKPSEYFARQCTVAASFMGPHESALRHQVGVESLMWGADYPHLEGTWPNTRESLALCFAGIPIDEVRTILTDNPARVYGFDVEALQPLADRVCPSFDELVGA